MRNFLIGLLMLGLVFVSCDNGTTNNENNNGNNGGNTEVIKWPEGFCYERMLNGELRNDSGAYQKSDKGVINFYNGNKPHMSYGGDVTYDLVSIEGKTITIKCSWVERPTITYAKVGQIFTLCTDYTVSGDTITLIGGDVHSSLSNTTLTRR